MEPNLEQAVAGTFINDVLPDEVTIDETGIGQIPLGNIRDNCEIRGKYGQHPSLSTMSLVVKVSGAEICYVLTGPSLDAYKQLVDGTSGQRRNALTLGFLRRYDLPCKVIGLQL